uniref:Uncharacterized protein n=1 Tax=Raoultella ornithinolytica TaxID=54291 RepID=A0A7G9A765_RAOOR|nr:Hypothetical protein [Raoultella ornithinolytica]
MSLDQSTPSAEKLLSLTLSFSLTGVVKVFLRSPDYVF